MKWGLCIYMQCLTIGDLLHEIGRSYPMQPVHDNLSKGLVVHVLRLVHLLVHVLGIGDIVSLDNDNFLFLFFHFHLHDPLYPL